MKIKINKQQFFECLVAVLLVLNGQSMWSKLETVQGWFSWLILGMLWIAAIGILYCSNSGKVEKQTVFSIFLITVYLAVYICVRPVNFNGTLQLVLSVIAISMIVFETKDISGILQYYRKTIIIIATISLFFWVFGSMLSYLQPSSEIYSIWTGNGEYGVPVRIARLAQTFGAGILPGENRVFAQFARSVIRNENIVLHTKGLSEGNYCYTSDTCLALLLLLEKGTNGEAYNISNPTTHTTIANMASMVCDKIAENKIKVVFDVPESNTYGYAADTKMRLNIDKMRKLGWTPRVGLEEAYRRLIGSMVQTNE